MTDSATLLRHRLANGLRVVLAPDPEVPVASAVLFYGVGSAYERPGRTGFAHLFEHMMFQGSANVGKTQHMRDIQAIGGVSNAYTNWDSTTYVNTVPSNELPLVLWMEADRMATLADVITRETLDNQCEVVKNERRDRVDNVPYGDAEELLFEAILPDGHPYAHSRLGAMSDLDAASLDDVRAFYRTFYVPNNAVLAIAGDLEADAVLEQVERYFGEIPAGPDPHPVPGAIPLTIDAPMRLEHRAEVPSPRLYTACRIEPFGTDGWDLADLISELLYVGRASRLRRRLIRELRLATEVDAYAYELAGGVSLLEVDVWAADGVEPDVIDAALANELERLATEPPGEDELQRVRTQRATTRAAARQYRESRAERIGLYACVFDEPERFGQEDERDLAATGERIAEFARGPLSAENRVSLWYLPAEG
jgi:predicted Zn-dependent peptidase